MKSSSCTMLSAPGVHHKVSSANSEANPFLFDKLKTVNNSQVQKVPNKKESVFCNLCGKTFSEKSNLNVHYKIHTGEKNFVCDICSKAFVTKFNLIKHYRIHTGEKPFECSVCRKAFNQETSLKSHYFRIHAREQC